LSHNNLDAKVQVHVMPKIVATARIFNLPMCGIENKKKEKKLVVKKHNDTLPEEQKCSLKLAEAPFATPLGRLTSLV